MTEFFAMGGYAFYVWGAYGVTALVLVVEVLALRGRRKAALEEARLSGPEDIPAAASGRGAA
jgi:heme exporter protein D